MIKTYAKGAVMALFLGLSAAVFSQNGNISMNLGGAASHNPAILDLSDPSNAHLGFLMPNVNLGSATDNTTIPIPTTGMIVWNSNSGMPFGVGFYYWDGVQWDFLYNSGSAVAGANLTSGIGVTSFTYNGTAPATVGLANTAVTVGSYGDASNYATYTVNAQGQLTAAGTFPLPTTLPPSGTAGGDLSNTYPNPTVSQINGSPLGTTTGASTGEALIWNGTNWAPGILSSGGVTNVTASAPLASSGGTTPNISLTGTVAVANGGTGTASAPTNGQFLIGGAGGYSPANLSSTGGTIAVTNGVNTLNVDIANTTVVPNPYGSATQVATFTVNSRGQLTSAGNTTITGVSPVGSALASTDIWVGNGVNLATAVAMSGDATISNTGAVKVNALESATTSVNVNLATAPTLGQVLTATSGTAATWQTPATAPVGSNPAALVGLTATNGSATTYMRSDAAPALNVAIIPTWTGDHIFSGAGTGVTVTTATNLQGTTTLGKASTAGVLVVGDAEATPKTATIQSPATITTSYSLALPVAAAGSTGMVLGVPASTGQLGWITPVAGTVTGTGTATQVAFWSGASALSSNSNMYWDNTNSRLGLKNSTPLVTFDVGGTIHMTGEASPNVTTQGGYLSWNTLCCNGEMDFIDNKGGGSGGFMFFNSTSLTAPLLFLNSSGAIMPNNLAGSPGQVLTSQGSGAAPTWTTPTTGTLTAANNGVSVSGTTVQLGDPAAGPYPSVITGSRWITQNGSNLVYDFSNGTTTQNVSATANWSIQNGGTSNPYVYVMNNASTNNSPTVPGPLVGIGTSTPATALDVAQNNAIRVGATYISSGSWTGSAGFADFASNAWYDGSNWHFPNQTNSNNSGAFQFANDAFSVYQTTTPFSQTSFIQRFNIAGYTASNNYQGNVTIGNAATSANLLNVGVTTANATGMGFGILMTAQQGAASSAGGAVAINAGAGGSTSGTGGAAALTAGASASGTGGAATLAGGNSAAGVGGQVNIKAGTSAGGTNAGANIIIQPSPGVSTGTSGGVSISTNGMTPSSTLDVNGSIAGRASPVTLSASGILTVGNTSHIMITSTGAGATVTTPWTFTLPAGQPGQYLTIEQVAGYSTIVKGSANVQITSTAFFFPYSTMTLKYDGTYWVELTRNASVISYTPVTLSGNPPTTYNGKQVFTYNGGNQTFNVPSYVTQVYVKLWGAGGGGGYYGEGGPGAYVGGYFNVTAGSTFTVVVGGGGQGDAVSATGGFGGGGPSGTNTSGNYYGGGGGGRAAIQTTSGTDVVTAGGGGGGGGYIYTNPPGGGGGGATTGVTGTTSATAGSGGGGATTSAGGIAGTGNAANGTAGGIGNIWLGGTGGAGYYGGGGGGGGYYGGGGGGTGTNSTAGEKANGGGGGGSSYTTNLVAGFTNTAGANSGSECTQSTAPNTADADYIATGLGVGTGGWSPSCEATENGGPGEVVIYW